MRYTNNITAPKTTIAAVLFLLFASSVFILGFVLAMLALFAPVIALVVTIVGFATGNTLVGVLGIFLILVTIFFWRGKVKINR